MKLSRIIFIMVCLCCCSNIGAVDYILPSDAIVMDGISIDSMGYDHAPESVYVTTILGSVVKYTNKYGLVDPEVTASGDYWIFTDQFQDIDGSGGNGYYTIRFEYLYWHGGYGGSPTRRCTIVRHKDVYIGAEARFKSDVSNLDVTVSSRAAEASLAALSTHDATDVYTEFISGSNEDVFKATVTNLDVAVSSRSSHDEAGVYAEFISGSNENEFKADVSNLDATVSSRSSHTAANVYTEFISGANEDIFKSDSVWITTLLAAYIDSNVVHLPDGGGTLATKTVTGTTADTIRYWQNSVYKGRLIITHASGDPTPDSTWYEETGP